MSNDLNRCKVCICPALLTNYTSVTACSLTLGAWLYDGLTSMAQCRIARDAIRLLVSFYMLQTLVYLERFLLTADNKVLRILSASSPLKSSFSFTQSYFVDWVACSCKSLTLCQEFYGNFCFPIQEQGNFEHLYFEVFMLEFFEFCWASLVFLPNTPRCYRRPATRFLERAHVEKTQRVRDMSKAGYVYVLLRLELYKRFFFSLCRGSDSPTRKCISVLWP